MPSGDPQSSPHRPSSGSAEHLVVRAGFIATSRARYAPSLPCIRMGFDGKRRTRLAALGVGGICVNLAVGSAFGATPPGPSSPADKLVKTAISAADKVGSVRVTVHFFSGKSTGVLIEDSARSSAEQTVAIGKERASIVLVDGTVYFSGNNSGLVDYFGLTQALASTLSNRWISASPTDTVYASLTAGLTLPSALKEVTPTGQVTKGRSRTIDGRSTASVSGAGPSGIAQVSLFIAKQGRPLPVEAVGSDRTKSRTSGEIVDFSRWGEALHVPLPTNAIPISALSGASADSG
jgi:hypothetical protein